MSGGSANSNSLTAGEPLHRRTSRLTWLYISALTTVAVLSLTGQILVQRSLHRQHGDSTVVNIAGRQRMLSQRLTKAALAWNHATDDVERKARDQEITETLELWQRSHLGLQQGDQLTQLTPNSSAVVTGQFAELEPIFSAMHSAATQLTDAPHEKRAVLLGTLLSSEPKYLAAMDAIVFQLDREAQARVARLQRIEWALLSLTLAVLIVEGWLVFRPAVQSIRAAADALVESQEQLRIAKEAAESANEQKTRFLATLSHELRNPLHAALGNLELLLATPLTKDQLEHLTTVDNSARSLLGLVNDLLDLACIQAGKLRVTATSCDLVELAKRCVAMIEPQAERKGLRVSLQLLDEPLRIQADPLRVQQVLLNLLGNAVKFTNSGWITLRIGRLEPIREVRLEVIDNGPGIPRDSQQTIFAAFTQGDASPRREHSGVGLGLAISAGLVALMNGRIGVTSEPGQGSRFWVELPMGDLNASAAPASMPVQVEQPAARQRVLIAEDDAVNRRLLSDFLEVLGHEAVVAVDGRAALARFQEQRYDCVLLDWHMPQLDGLALAKEVRRWEQTHHLPRIPLIAISAAGATVDAADAQAAGIDRILSKPLGLNQLRAALTSLTGLSSAGEMPAMPAEARFAGALARMQGKRDLFNAVAKIFLDQLPEELKHLEILGEKQDFGELARAAHQLRGQATNFDATALVTATAELEEAAIARNPDRCTRIIGEILLAASQLKDELRAAIEFAATHSASSSPT